MTRLRLFIPSGGELQIAHIRDDPFDSGRGIDRHAQHFQPFGGISQIRIGFDKGSFKHDAMIAQRCSWIEWSASP
jgi:hypothetical protein